MCMVLLMGRNTASLPSVIHRSATSVLSFICQIILQAVKKPVINRVYVFPQSDQTLFYVPLEGGSLNWCFHVLNLKMYLLVTDLLNLQL